jgi:Proton-conducting membrane transporter
MWMIATMAKLTEAPPVSALWLRLALVAGPAVFLATGVAGIAVAGGFLAYPAGFAKPLILFIETFMTSAILATLGSAAILSGSVLALRQERLKLLIAYSTVAQIGYLFLMFPPRPARIPGPGAPPAARPRRRHDCCVGGCLPRVRRLRCRI